MDCFRELAMECYQRLEREFEEEKELSPNLTLRKFSVKGREERGIFGRGEGKYLTLEFRENLLNPALTAEAIRSTANALGYLIKGFHTKIKRVLIAGLGNSKIRADSLGYETVTRLNSLHRRERIKTVFPSVYGETGVESADVIKGVAQAIAPDLVIAVDTLVCRVPKNMFGTIQITDAGITPGAGVGNHRKSVDFSTLGVPVIAMGMPLLSYTQSHPHYGDMVVTPKEVDFMVNRGGELLSKAICKAVL